MQTHQLRRVLNICMCVYFQRQFDIKKPIGGVTGKNMLASKVNAADMKINESELTL